jgi:hypothetical protein
MRQITLHLTEHDGVPKMRPHGKTKLGFYPLPVPEAERLRNCLVFPPEFSALDPCVGDGAAFTHLLHGT